MLKKQSRRFGFPSQRAFQWWSQNCRSPSGLFRNYFFVCGQLIGNPGVPQRVPFGQHFLGAQNLPVALCSCILIPKYYLFSHKLVVFLELTLLLPQFLGIYALVYHELLCDVLSPCCLHFKAHLLHIFRMSVEHFPNFLRIFLYIEMIFFFLHCAPKPQAVVVTTLCFISQRRISYFMLFICLITINIFRVFCNPCHGRFFRKEEKERNNLSRFNMRSYVKKIIDFDYTS